MFPVFLRTTLTGILAALSMSRFFLLLNSGMTEKFLRHEERVQKQVYLAFQLLSVESVKIAYLLIWLTALSNLSRNLNNHLGAMPLLALVMTWPFKKH